MLKEILLSASRNAVFRNLARAAFAIPLLGPGLRRASEQILPRGQRTWVQVSLPDGAAVWMKVEPYWEPGYLRGEAEPGVLDALKRHLQPGGRFYDVGAHVGFYSLFASRIVGATGGVVAFEPDPELAEILRETFARNGLTRAEIAQFAVWNYDGAIDFARGLDIPSRMGGRALTIGDTPSSGSIVGERLRSRAVRLDTFAASSPRPTVIKVDVEGGELAVLEGALVLLRESRPALLIEVHNPAELPRLDQLLLPLGYKSERIASTERKLHVSYAP